MKLSQLFGATLSSIWKTLYHAAASDKGITLSPFLLLLAILYVLAYLGHEALPGQTAVHPIGWWGWFDQGEYLKSTAAFANFDFSQDKHFYPPLYSLLGAFFFHYSPGHPFFLVNLLCFLLVAAGFIKITETIIPRLAAMALFCIVVILPYYIFEQYLIPWSSTLSAALITLLLLQLLRLDSVSKPSYCSSFLFSLTAGLLVPIRPIDAGMVLPLYGFYLYRVYQAELSGRGHGILAIARYCIPLFFGGVLGVIIFITYNILTYDDILGKYVKIASSNGFFFLDLFEKFISLLFNSNTLYLEKGQTFLYRMPWLSLTIFGMGIVLCAGPFMLRAVTSVVVLQMLLYLPYADLLPSSLYRYLNIHYFKWSIPYASLLAVYSLIYVYHNRRKGVIVAGCCAWLGVVAVITSLSYDIQRTPAEVIIEEHDRETMVFTASSVPLDFLDVEAVQSSFTDLYFGAHEVKVDGQKLVHVRDFRLLPAPWGARLLFIRPVHAKSISLSLDSRINFTPRRNGVLAGTYHFIFEPPRWIGYDSKVSGPLYQIGTKIYANEPSLLADSVFGPGWSSEEQWGRWSDGSDAVLVIRFMQPATSDLALYMRAGAFLAAGLPQQRVKVSVNDQPVELLTFWEVGGLRDIIVPLSLDLIAGAKQLTIRLNMPDAHSPASLGLSSDRRKLGVGLEWVMIAPTAVGN